MLRLSEIRLENVQINHKADTTFTSFQGHWRSQNADGLMYYLSTLYQYMEKKKKKKKKKAFTLTLS